MVTMLAGASAFGPTDGLTEDAPGPASAADGEWTKVLMTEGASRGAVCLDGSPGGFFFRKGSGKGANKWIVFHQVPLPPSPPSPPSLA